MIYYYTFVKDGYLYGIKSERRLVEEVQLNIAYRWFCGFELDDTIPNHSTFSKTRTRKWQQSSLFQKAFYEIVKQCIDSGLIDGEAMAADGSYIPANVSRESWINVETEVEQSMQSYLDSLDEELSNQPGFKKPPTKIVRKCRITSQTDPDSGYINHGSKRGIGYLMEATVDCKHGILTGVDVYSANEKESVLILRHLERQINLGIPMSRLALDRGYETGAVHRGLELLGITGYIPAIQFSNPPEKYGFSYDPQLDAFICPEGTPLTYHRLNCSKSTGKYLRCYQVEGDACMRCPKRPGCFDKAGIRRRVLASSCYPAFFRGHQRVGTPEYLAMMRLRKIWAEGSFSVLKREHCISRIRKRGILAATEECLLAAMALNLKRMAKCHLSLSPNLLFCWNHCGFQQFFYFCQQVHNNTTTTFVMENSKASVKVADNDSIYANSKTVFVVKNSDGDWNVYTGIKGAPDIKANGKDVYVAYYCKTADMATVMFIDASAAGVTITGNNSKTLYLAGESQSKKITDKNSKVDYYEVNAVIGGEVTVAKVEADLFDTLTSKATANKSYIATGVSKDTYNFLFDSYTTNNDGVITGVTKYDDAKCIAGVKTDKISGEYTVKLGSASWTVAEDAKIWLVDKDGEITSATIKSVKKDDNDTFIYTTKDGEVTNLFIQEVEDSVTPEDPEVDSTIKSVALSDNGTITLTLTAAASQTKETSYTASVSMWNAATAEYKTIDTVTVKVAAGQTTGTASAAALMVNGTLYKVSVGGVDSPAVVASK